MRESPPTQSCSPPPPTHPFTRVLGATPPPAVGPTAHKKPLQNGIELLRPHEGASNLARRLILILLNLFAYIAEGYNAVRLIINPHDSTPVYALTTLLLVVYILSITRAWELLGGARRPLTHLHHRQP